MNENGISGMVKISIYVLVGLMMVYTAQCQYPNLKFENLDTAEGLSSSTCTEIFQDSEGFLWFGTIDGLNRFDGYTFKVYRPVPNDENSISNNRINSIAEDANGNLWIGTGNGLNVLEKKTGKFHRILLFKNESDISIFRTTINDVLFDASKNDLWVATKNGMVQINLENARELPYANITYSYYSHKEGYAGSVDNNDVVRIRMDGENTIWAATSGKHLNHFDPRTNSFERVLIDAKVPFELDQLPKNLLIDNDGDFWIGNDLSRLVHWNRKKNVFQVRKLMNERIPIFNLYQDRKGIIWVATDGDGIYLLDKTKESIQHIGHSPTNPFSLPNDQPSNILEDRDGIFWFSSYNKGISKAIPSSSAFGHYFYQSDNPNSLSSKIAQAVLEDSENRIWIGTDGGGLNLFNEQANTFLHFRSDPQNPNSIGSDKILYLLESYDRSIWVCSWDGGLSKFDPETQKARNFKYDPRDTTSLGRNTVWCAVEDKKHRLWSGTQTAGLNLMDPVTEKFYKYRNIPGDTGSLTSNFVFHLFIDSKDRLLVGTSLGLCYTKLDSMEGFIPDRINFKRLGNKAINGNRINNIAEDSHHNIWLGTDLGLYQMDLELNLLQSYTTKEGLPNNLVLGIQEDNYGLIWITTKSGLSRLNAYTGSITNYNVHDGIQGMEFQSKSIEKTHDGRIIAGGINGFNIFSPHNLASESLSIVPKITGIKLFNEAIKVGDSIKGRVILKNDLSDIPRIVLKHNEGYVGFDFVALHYSNPERVKYAYRMKGLDKDFVMAGGHRTANYSSLLPGNYTFEVKATLDGNWEDAPITPISIRVLSPPWKTWWAYSLYMLTFLCVFWLAMRYYTKTVREEKERELDQMKLRFFINVSHEFRTPLTLILSPLEKILGSHEVYGEVRNAALVIQQSARRLLNLVNQLLDLRKMELGKTPLKLIKGDIIEFTHEIYLHFVDLAASKHIKLSFDAPKKGIISSFDPDKLEKILTNLLTNAIKFTDYGGSVSVSVSTTMVEKTDRKGKLFKRLKSGDFVEFKISDTGIGFKKTQLKDVFARFFHADDAKTGTGIGLNFTKGLVELYGGEITVESQYKKGSIFKVLLPIEPKGKVEYLSVKEGLSHGFDPMPLEAAKYEIAIADNEKDKTIKKGTDSMAQSKKPLLLIVEDNKELRAHLKNELHSIYRIKEAANGAKGVEMTQKYYPDLIISDVMMPKMDGFEFCRKVKTEIETCHIPVVLLTARSQEEDKIEGYQTGADEYLPKPFSVKVLKARVKNLLEAKKRLRDKFVAMGGIVPSSEITTNTLDEVFLDRTTKIVLDNISDSDFKLESLLKEIGIGRSQFYRKINSLTGQNPSNFIRTVRLKYASELLVKNELSIKEITHLSGFNSTAYFSKTFREFFGLTPTQFQLQKTKIISK